MPKQAVTTLGSRDKISYINIKGHRYHQGHYNYIPLNIATSSLPSFRLFLKFVIGVWSPKFNSPSALIELTTVLRLNIPGNQKISAPSDDAVHGNVAIESIIGVFAKITICWVQWNACIKPCKTKLTKLQDVTYAYTKSLSLSSTPN